jgi:hypothetical protein
MPRLLAGPSTVQPFRRPSTLLPPPSVNPLASSLWPMSKLPQSPPTLEEPPPLPPPSTPPLENFRQKSKLFVGNLTSQSSSASSGHWRMWSWCGATMILRATSVGRWCRHAGERRRSAARGCGGAAVLSGSPWTVGCPAGAAATRVRGTTTVSLRHCRRGQQCVELRTVPVPPSRLSPPFNPAHSNPHTPTTLL